MRRSHYELLLFSNKDPDHLLDRDIAYNSIVFSEKHQLIVLPQIKVR